MNEELLNALNELTKELKSKNSSITIPLSEYESLKELEKKLEKSEALNTEFSEYIYYVTFYSQIHYQTIINMVHEKLGYRYVLSEPHEHTRTIFKKKTN
jgi:hypothetical protein